MEREDKSILCRCSRQDRFIVLFFGLMKLGKLLLVLSPYHFIVQFVM